MLDICLFVLKICQIFFDTGKYLFPPLLSPSPDHRCVATCAAIAHRGSGSSSVAKCEIVSFSIKAWQDDCLKLSKREYIFKPGMQFVLSARRTLTGLPDIGSYKVSQPPTTTTTIQPSTLWSQQVSTSLSTMITIQRLTNPQQVSTRKNVCQHLICWLWLSSYNCLSHDCMIHIRPEICQTKSLLDFWAIHFTH